MRITIMTGDGSYGCSDINGDDDVDHALDVFSRAMVAAGFAEHRYTIDEEQYDQRTKQVLQGVCCAENCTGIE